jgi:non-specific serine/threonine protein kinase
VGQLVAGLTNRFGLLSAQCAVPEHHRTLRATFEWSYALCTQQEQALWTRIAVFRSGFDLEAVIAVCADERLPADSMLDLIVGLVDKSIIRRDQSVEPARYRLLDSVREYGLVLLRADADMRAAMARRHADWYLRCVEQFDRACFGPEQSRLSVSISADLDNLRAALGYCLATPDRVRAGLRIAAGLRYYWTICGGLGEGRYWLARALVADPAPTVERAAALSAQTRVLITQGSHADAAASAVECRQLARQLADPLLITWAIHRVSPMVRLPVIHPPSRPAIARYDSWPAKPREISSRSASVSDDARRRRRTGGTNPPLAFTTP